MSRETVAFYPYSGTETYISKMRSFIESRYDVIDYTHLKKGYYRLAEIRTIYLNWIEDLLDECDRKILYMARFLRIKVIWVFHNKIPHDTDDEKKIISNIQYLIRICSKIIIHSSNSLQYLKEYDPQLNSKKVFFIPHPDFVGDYCYFTTNDKQLMKDNDDFVFAFYGKIRPYKNIECIIKAFKRLNTDEKCRLLIAGQPSPISYCEELQDLIGNDARICLEARRINTLEMGRYLEYADVLVLPYNLKSSMNSGVMIMAFSYGKTVITSDYCMAQDFPEDLIYKYHYTDEENHIKMLTQKMLEAYDCGRQENSLKGEKLLDIVKRNNDTEKVRDAILCLI